MANRGVAIHQTFLYQKVAFKAVPLHQLFQLPLMLPIMIAQLYGYVYFFPSRWTHSPPQKKTIWL